MTNRTIEIKENSPATDSLLADGAGCRSATTKRIWSVWPILYILCTEKQMVSGSFDILSHIMETYFSEPNGW